MGLLQSDGFLRDNSNAAQRLLDGVNLVAQSVSELSVKPAKAVTSWLTDQIAPAYWKPNSLISVSDTRRPAPPARHPPTSHQPSQRFPARRRVYRLSPRSSYTILRFAGHKMKPVLARRAVLPRDVSCCFVSCVQGVPQMSRSLPGQRHQTSLPCLRGGLL